MKLSSRQRATNRLELSMTSMIDVVFLLLIFFLVTTTFVPPENQLSSNIKVEDKGLSEAVDLEPAIIDLKMEDSKIVYRLGGMKTTRLGEIEKVLRAFEGKERGAFVRVADDVPFGYAAKVIGLCRQHSFPTVSYLPLP